MNTLPEICHEASGVVGVWKPSGLPTQAPAGIPSVEAWLRTRLGAGAYLGVPHRLDRAVSGVMLFASTPRAARQLSRQFERRAIRKTYLALADATDGADALEAFSRCPEEAAIWTDLMEKVPDEPRGRIVTAASATGKPAITHARLLARLRDGAVAVLHLEPQTGRMHQLRLQAAGRGLPILGDDLYGGPPDGGTPPGNSREAAIALHARRITFSDPDSQMPVMLEAPLPAAWPEEVAAVIRARGA